MAHVDRLANTHVLVFGGTSGIGFAIANMALSHGARVTISGSGQPKVDTKVEKLRSFYPNMPASNVAGVACDLSDKANLEKNLNTLFEKVTDSGKNKVDHIAFTAGDVGAIPKVSDVTVDTIMNPFLVRFIAPSIIAKILSTGKYMAASDSSSFTVTGGTNSQRPHPNWVFMAAAGASMEGLTRGLALDLKPIRVNCVIPGAIHTELFQGLLDNSTPEAIEKMKQGYSLLGTFGQPEDIAEAYGYIMRDRFANGREVTSDGGRMLVPTEF